MVEAQLGVARVPEPERVLDARPLLDRPEVEDRLVDDELGPVGRPRGDHREGGEKRGQR